MLYQIVNGAVAFAADIILHNINFEIRSTEKIAVVGRNGCGKTTLLKLIAGEVELTKRSSDEDIFIAKAGRPVIGYLKQMAFEDDSITMEQEIQKVFLPMEKKKAELNILIEKMGQDYSKQVMEKYSKLEEEFRLIGGYNYEKEYEIMITKFGFSEEDKKKPLYKFSGGQQTRIAFIRLLLSKPDILLLDEPTNHLDMETVEWLETYLKNYEKAIVVVSHDRMFLDKIVDVVYEIEYRTAKRYPGNYSDFIRRKRENYEKQMKDHILQQKEIKRLQTIVDKYKNKPTKVAMTRSKKKMIEHMDIIEAPDQYDIKTFHAKFQPAKESGKEVLKVEKLAIGYEKVLAQISFTLNKGNKVGIIGGNGLGKSTFLRTLIGETPALSGQMEWGFQVSIGYFNQQMAQYSVDKRVIEDYWDQFPNLTQTEVRSDLGAFLFSGDQVFKNINMLSGGEKVRLALCKILKRKPNLLILDEPTNHLDIIGRETLEAILKDYKGTVLFVSHDRYFIKQIANRLLVFSKEDVTYYEYGYQEYLKDKQEKESYPASKKECPTVQNKNPIGKKPNFQKERKQKEKEKKQKQIEDEIQIYEEEIRKKQKEQENPQNLSDYQRLAALQKEQRELEIKLIELLSQWEELSS